MSRAAVEEILQKIDALPERDRKRLDQELAARADAEWQRLSKQARAKARRRGIDQAMIDRVVGQVRYGRRRWRSSSTRTSTSPKPCSAAAPSA
jgi:hypothetical protein